MVMMVIVIAKIKEPRRREEVMKIRGVKIVLGFLLMAGAVLLVSNVSFAEDKNPFGAPILAAYFDQDRDGGKSNIPMFNAPLHPPRHIAFFDRRDRDDKKDGGNHYGWWKKPNFHPHPSPCR
jgi:hypothetical protein